MGVGRVLMGRRYIRCCLLESGWGSARKAPVSACLGRGLLLERKGMGKCSFSLRYLKNHILFGS